MARTRHHGKSYSAQQRTSQRGRPNIVQQVQEPEYTEGHWRVTTQTFTTGTSQPRVVNKEPVQGDTPEFEVERIRSYQYKPSSETPNQWLIQWKGCPKEESTWAPTEHLSHCEDTLYDWIHDHLDDSDLSPSHGVRPIFADEDYTVTSKCAFMVRLTNQDRQATTSKRKKTGLDGVDFAGVYPGQDKLSEGGRLLALPQYE